MERARTETAARVRRIVSRSLLVLGGVVAGTAAAWVLSSATASADTQPAPGLGNLQVPEQGALDNPVVHNANQAIKHADTVVRQTVTAPTRTAPIDLSTVVGDVDATLHGQNSGPTPGLSDLGAKANDAFEQFRSDLAERFGLPRSSGEIQAPGVQGGPPATGSPSDSSPVVRPTVHPPSAGPTATTDSFTDPALRHRVQLGGMNRGSPEPALPDPLRLPVAPVPTAPGSAGHTSVGANDGPAFGAVSLTTFRTILAMAGTSSPAIAGAPVDTGAQPGATPD